MELHMRGVELMGELLDAADHFDRMKPAEVKALLREAASVLGDILARAVPLEPEMSQKP